MYMKIITDLNGTIHLHSAKSVLVGLKPISYRHISKPGTPMNFSYNFIFFVWFNGDMQVRI